ncbi:hypothetical protein FGF1_03280 [Flavobacteriaceae bacterium GF1]
MSWRGELVFALITIASTLPIPWPEIGLKFLVAIAAYFVSRIVYRYFREDINRWVDKLKKK